MNPGIRTRWVTALRSEQFEQGFGALHKDRQFCCLGVLCELAYEEGVVGKQKNPTGRNYWYDGNPYTLPRSVIDWAGLDNPDVPVEMPNGLTHALTYLNDACGLNFNQIADLIERQL